MSRREKKWLEREGQRRINGEGRGGLGEGRRGEKGNGI